MAEFWVDQRNDSVGNGTEGDPWKDPTFANNVVAGSLVEFVPGSGLYRLAGSQIRLRNSNVIWDLNGCEISGAVNLNNGSYEWHKSQAENQWYCTLPGGTNPGLSTVKTCDVGGYINDEDKGIGHSIESSDPSNWRFGDYDSLGFSTLYVKWWNGKEYDSPANGDFRVNAAQLDYVFWGNTASGGMILKNGIISGGNRYLGYMYGGLSLENLTLKNCNEHALDYSGGGSHTKIVKNCYFKSCGHRGFLVSDTITLNVYNSFFEETHLCGIVKSSAGAMTLNFINNIAWNMDAGIFSVEGTEATINEDYNCLHVDSDSPHAGKIFNYEIGATLWTQTGAHSLPGSSPTNINIDDRSEQNGVDAEAFGNGKISKISPCVDAGMWIPGANDSGQADPWGKKVYGVPNIGRDQGAGMPMTGGPQILDLGTGRGIFG